LNSAQTSDRFSVISQKAMKVTKAVGGGFVSKNSGVYCRRMISAGARPWSRSWPVSGGKGTAAAKIEAMLDAGIAVAPTPAALAETLLSRWGK